MATGISVGGTAIDVLLGYGYHPATTGTYLQRALERRATPIFAGTPWQARPGFAATGDLRPIAADLPSPPALYLYVDSGATAYFPRGLTDLECPTACYLIDVHVRSKILLKQALFFDYAFSAQRDFVDTLRQAGHPQAHWLPLACDSATHRRYDVPKRYDVGFAGATAGRYARRRVLVERLARRYTVNDYTRGYTPDEMSRLYSESRLVFNCALRGEVNMRVFEGPATGSMLLTDRIGNGLSELMTDREHVVMYDDASLVDLADAYLRDDAARERIAEAGYEHVHRHHTYDRRADAILDTIFSVGGPRLLAPLRRRSDGDVQVAYAEMYALMGRIDDTIAQLHSAPPRWRYRLPAALHLTLCLLRRLRYG